MASNTTGEKAPSVKASSVKAESVEAPSEKVPSKKVPSVKAPSIEAASVRSSLIKDDPFKTASIESVDTESLDEDVMDSGRRAWMTMIGGFLTGAVTFGYANSFGVYQDLYTRSNTASASAISWIGSTQLFFLFAMGLPAGKLLDMGHFRVTTAVGSLIYVFSLFMISICNTDKYYQLYLAQGLGMGIGGGLLYVPCIAVQSHHWRARRALAMGVVATGE
ncbi:unnamed protein product [Cyclocybe aegerita]|uniref:Uncharacterized protein n=1 Tax=Cyclocybe aegerita TaxID=1973307 RepID=A0A8S0XPT7_CYCAE|nr:unnamed protein product [Cyclocybe aegerita]